MDRDDALAELAVALLGEVQVVGALARAVGDSPFHLDVGLQLFHEADADAAIARHVDPRQAFFPGVRGRLLEENVLLHAGGARLVRHIVGNRHDTAPVRVLGSLHRAAPRHPADVVRAGFTAPLLQLTGLAEGSAVL